MQSMTSINKIFLVLTIVSFMIPGVLTNAIGQESMRRGDKSLCKNGDRQRSVEIQYYEQEKSVPCEIHYYKDTENPGMGQVLWRAANEAGFCEKKMAVFIKDLSDLGWDCEPAAEIPSDDRLKDSRKEVLPPDLASE